jgi:hypothetical protein
VDFGTIDYGPYVGRLRGFGPPEVIPMPNHAGNAVTTEAASVFWERIEAVTFTLVTNGTAGNRRARVRWFAGESVPFAAVVSPATVPASTTSILSFVRDTQAAGAAADPTIVGILPELWLLPKWSVVVDLVGGLAGDAVSNVRICRVRAELVEIPAIPDDTLG